MFRYTGFVSIFRWREETTTLLGSLERAHFGHWTNGCSFLHVALSSGLEFGRWTKYTDPVIPNVTEDRQNRTGAETDSEHELIGVQEPEGSWRCLGQSPLTPNLSHVNPIHSLPSHSLGLSCHFILVFTGVAIETSQTFHLITTQSKTQEIIPHFFWVSTA
jgi:hypothetical protein